MASKQDNPLVVARQQARMERVAQIKQGEKVTVNDLGYLYKVPLHEIRELLTGLDGKRGFYNTQDALERTKTLTIVQ